MKETPAHKSRAIRIQKTPERQRQMFFVCSGAAIALVAVGWFFSMRNAVLKISGSVPAVSELAAIREQFETVSGTLVENAEAPRAEMQGLLKPTAQGIEDTLQESLSQRDAAAGVVGEVFLENLSDPSAPEAEPDQADADSSDASAPLVP